MSVYHSYFQLLSIKSSLQSKLHSERTALLHSTYTENYCVSWLLKFCSVQMSSYEILYVDQVTAGHIQAWTLRDNMSVNNLWICRCPYFQPDPLVGPYFQKPAVCMSIALIHRTLFYIFVLLYIKHHPRVIKGNKYTRLNRPFS